MQRNIFSCFISLKSNRMPLLSGFWLVGYFVTELARRFSSVSQDMSRSNFRSSLRGFSHKTRKIDNASSSSFISKPPNILIYTGKEDKERKFGAVKAQLHEVLGRDSYTVYLLDDNKVLGHPWSKNSILLVIYNSECMKGRIRDEFKKYIKDGGNILFVGRECKELKNGVGLENLQLDSTKTCIVDVEMDTWDVQENTLQVNCEPFCFSVVNNDCEILIKEKKSRSPVMIYHEDQKSKIILSTADVFHQNHHEARVLLQAVLKKLDMKCTSHDLPILTPAYLFANEKDKLELVEHLKPYLTEGWCKGQNVSLLICNMSKLGNMKVTENKLPVIIDQSSGVTIRFDWKTYLQHLRTHSLGRIMVYTDVIHSTQALLEGNQTFVKSIPEHSGVVAVTNQQLKGKGRGGNAWLSPAGCMMFSVVVRVKFDTELGSRLPYIQHIASLAFILAVKGIPGYENINICLKWPNDIYYERSVKIGGVVISSTALGNKLNAIIGMGVNVSNKQPTVCINEIIKKFNIGNGTNLAPLQIEALLARTISHMEELIDAFQVNGKDSFLEKYYQHWMHGGSKVTVNTGSSLHQVTVIGLDDFGFLMVKKDTGQVISLQPDGNTFDILANLIEIKT